jgi:hypothetical protein
MIQPVMLALSAAPVVAGGISAIPVPVTTVIADSGQLPAGDYLVEVLMGYSDAAGAGKYLSVEHRNAANNGTVRELGLCPAGSSVTTRMERVTVALNERIRIITGAVVGAASSVASASVRCYKIAAV